MIEIIAEYYGDSYERLLDEYHASQVTRINERYVVVSGNVGTMPDYRYVNYEYSQIPKCYGLLAADHLEEIGVAQIRKTENLALRGCFSKRTGRPKSRRCMIRSWISGIPERRSTGRFSRKIRLPRFRAAIRTAMEPMSRGLFPETKNRIPTAASRRTAT